MEKEIINRVENSSLIQLNLDDFYPMGDRVTFDITPFLEQGLILKEKSFREAVKLTDWSVYDNKYVAVLFKEDAIVPLWAYMLIASKLTEVAQKVVLGTLSELETAIFDDVFASMDVAPYINKNIILKGCGKKPIPNAVYIKFFLMLQQHAKSVMFGEACSSVPVFKKSKS